MTLQLFKHFCRSQLFSNSRLSVCRAFGSISPPTPVPSVKLTAVEVSDQLQKIIPTVRMSDFIYANDTPVVLLDCEKAFNALTEKEKLYSHHFSRASWYGGLIVLVQTSPESPLIYLLLNKLFKHQSPDELKSIATTECDFTDEEFKALLVYACAFFGNMGNYKGFGDLKFIPNLPKDKFVKLIQKSKCFLMQPNEVKSLLDRCVDKIYSLDEKEKQLGFSENGVTTYLSKNFTKEDSNVVNVFLKDQKMEAYNTRAFKTGNGSYEIKLASVINTEDAEEKDLIKSHVLSGDKFSVTRGDYSKLLKLVNNCLLQAKEYAANETEVQMIEKYMRSFHTGSLDAHKEGSLLWVKDTGPTVETYIGFIETYRDPAGMRGEFEGFVAVVNKPMSKKFADLVSKAEELLPLLPWPNTYEKDKFLRPDFTSLDVLTFAGSGIPAGINIPNYDSIRQNKGFKNVSLGNVISSTFKGRKPNFVTKEDEALIEEWRTASFEVDVGLHELLGHGSGKMFKKEKDGFNFDPKTLKDLETGEKLTTWYDENDTYDSIFGSLGSAFEECRAECVAVYLSSYPHILKIFGHEGAAANDCIYMCWFGMCHAGLDGMQTYNPKSQSWLQAHCRARFAILHVCLEAGQGFLQIQQTTGEDGKPDLLMIMDRNKIQSVGKPAVGEFLKKLQLYRSTANIEKAKELFKKYTTVTNDGPHPFLTYHEIVMARKKPRRLFLEPNTNLKDGKVTLKTYDSTFEAFIQSWIDRYQDDDLEGIIEELWQKDQQYFA